MREFNGNKILPFLGLLVVLSAFLVLVGWQFDITVFKTAFSGMRPMNPVSAIGFIAIGMGIVFYYTPYRNRLAVKLFPAIAIYIGLVHVIAYLSHQPSIQFDYLLYPNKVKAYGAHTLIGANTAFCFLLCGFGLLSLSSKKIAVQLGRQGGLLLGLLIIYISIARDILNAEPDFRLAGMIPMELITSIDLFIVTIAILLMDTSYGFASIIVSRQQAGKILRLFTPLILIFPPIIRYLRLLGEHKGLYPAEIGFEMSTMLFVCVLLCFLGFYTALLKKKEAEEQEAKEIILHNESRLKAIMDTLSEGILEYNQAGIITYCNPALLHLLGYDITDLLGKPAIQAVIPSKNRELYNKLSESENSNAEEHIHEIETKYGNKLWIAVYARPFQTDQGYKATVIRIRDITREVKSIQDLQAFTNYAAHDIRSPLASIQMLASMLAGEKDEALRDNFISLIHTTAAKGINLLNELLEFSRLGSGELIRDHVNIQEMVDDIVREQKKLYANVLPIINPLPVITANEASVRQLFINLIGNAFKYSSKEEVPIVEIGADEHEGEIWIYIKDNGIGLREDQLKSLFIPFKRLNNEFEGTGMGLAIVKKVVEKHNGHIKAELNRDKGMTFSFTLNSINAN